MIFTHEIDIAIHKRVYPTGVFLCADNSNCQFIRHHQIVSNAIREIIEKQGLSISLLQYRNHVLLGII
jgi:hypothetical protein